MKVAFDIGPLVLQPTGVGVYVRSLASALAASPDGVGLALIGRRLDLGSRLAATSGPDGARRLPYPMWNLLQGGSAARAAAADVVHFTDGLVPLDRPRPTVVTVHDLSLVRRPWMHRVVRLARIPFVLAAPRLADRVIVPSSFTASEVMRLTGTPARSIDVVGLAPGPAFRPSSDLEMGEGLAARGLVHRRFLLAVGTIEPRKNHLRLLHAFERLASQGRIPADMVLVVAGSRGWRSEGIIRSLDSSPLGRRVLRLGYVADAEMRILMSGAALVAYLSDYEGFGLPIVEAMACGAPVVISDRPPLAEVAADGALVARIDDGLHLEAILADVLGDESMQIDLRHRGLARVAGMSWDATAAGTVAAYRAAIGR